MLYFFINLKKGEKMNLVEKLQTIYLEKLIMENDY